MTILSPAAANSAHDSPGSSYWRRVVGETCTTPESGTLALFCCLLPKCSASHTLVVWTMDFTVGAGARGPQRAL